MPTAENKTKQQLQHGGAITCEPLASTRRRADNSAAVLLAIQIWRNVKKYSRRDTFRRDLGWRKNLVDQTIIRAFEWVDERHALEREAILHIFGEQMLDADAFCRSP